MVVLLLMVLQQGLFCSRHQTTDSARHGGNITMLISTRLTVWERAALQSLRRNCFGLWTNTKLCLTAAQ